MPMQIRNQSKVLVRLALLALGAGALLIGARSATADEGPPGSPPASTFHEVLFTDELNIPGTSEARGFCNPDGPSTFEFTVTGQATSGAYLGPFTETGTVTLSPAGAGPNGVTRVITAFSARFRIFAGDSVVTGTQTLTDIPINGSAITQASCGALFAGDPMWISLFGNVAYTARVQGKGADGCFTGVGQLVYDETQTRGTPDQEGYRFSVGFNTADAADLHVCKGGGDQ